MLYLDNPSQFAIALKLLSGPVVLTLRKFREQRSSSQNRYLHGVVIPILADHPGYDDHQELKHELKRKFLLDPDRPLHDAGLLKTRSTADLNTAEMTEFIESVRRFAAVEFGCVIPNPGELE